MSRKTTINYIPSFRRQKNNYTTQSIAAEKAYKEAMLSSENASSQYSVDVSGATNDEDTAQDTLEDAKEALDDFNAMVGTDGVVYAEYSGAHHGCWM